MLTKVLLARPLLQILPPSVHMVLSSQMTAKVVSTPFARKLAGCRSASPSRRRSMGVIRAPSIRGTFGPAWPPTPHFYRQGPGQPGPQPLTFIDSPGPARPPTPHFYRQGPGRPGPQALTFIDRAKGGLAPQLLTSISQSLTSIGQTPHFY